MATVFADQEEISSVEIGTLTGGVALEALTRAEVDVQISTAKAYPRSIQAFKRTAMELATLDEETAASMFYNIPRAGKRIEGPSARMAEVIAYSWGNLRSEADVVAIDDKFVTAMGSCFDLERNVASRIRVKRGITDKNGKRFNDDMIRVTGQAACSIALREAVFKVVPRALFKDIYEAAKETSVGKALSTVQRRHNAFDWFAKAGVPADRVLAVLGRRGLDDVTLDDLIALTGVRTAIKDGDLTIEEAFPIVGGGKPSERVEDLTARVNAAASQAAPAQAPRPAPSPPPAESDGPSAEDSEPEPPESAYGKLAALVADTTPSGKGKAATDPQRARLVEIAETLEAGYTADPELLGDTPDTLSRLALDPALSMGQAGGLIGKGKDAVAELGLTLPSEQATVAAGDNLFGED